MFLHVYVSASVCVSVIQSVRPFIRDCMLSQYLQYLVMDFCQTFVIGASVHRDKPMINVLRSEGQRSGSHYQFYKNLKKF